MRPMFQYKLRTVVVLVFGLNCDFVSGQEPVAISDLLDSRPPRSRAEQAMKPIDSLGGFTPSLLLQGQYHELIRRGEIALATEEEVKAATGFGESAAVGLAMTFSRVQMEVARAYFKTGRPEEGHRHFKTAVHRMGRVLGPRARYLSYYGQALADQNELAEAESVLREAVDTAVEAHRAWQVSYPDEDPPRGETFDAPLARDALAEVVLRQGRLEEAWKIAQQAVEDREIAREWYRKASEWPPKPSGYSHFVPPDRAEIVISIDDVVHGRMSLAVDGFDGLQRQWHQYNSSGERLNATRMYFGLYRERDERDYGALNTAVSLLRASPSLKGLAPVALEWVLNRKAELRRELQGQAALLRHALANQRATRRRQSDTAMHSLTSNPTSAHLQKVMGLVAAAGLSQVTTDERLVVSEEFDVLDAAVHQMKRRAFSFADERQKAPEFHFAWASVQEVRDRLSPHTALVELIRYDEFDYEALKRGNFRWRPARYAAWVLKAEGEVAWIDLGEADAVDRSIREVRRQLQAAGGSSGTISNLGEERATSQLATPLQQLSDLLLKPLKPHLADTQDLIISPDAELWLCPWAALLWSNDEYLIEYRHLRFLTSGRELIGFVGKQDVSTQAPVIIADADFDLSPQGMEAAERELMGSLSRPLVLVERRGTSSLPSAPPLPYTRAEANSIAPAIQAYTNRKPKVYLGNHAIEALFTQIERPQLLVMSTHGFFASTEPNRRSHRLSVGQAVNRDVAAGTTLLDVRDPLLRCGLLLAGCNQRDKWEHLQARDGILTGYEIASLDLRGTELVVLSACDTGVGEVSNGEGVIGLRHAFLVAGADAVVASLWQIDDRATAQLITNFFDQLRDGKEEHTALGNAQRNQIRSRRERFGAAHPFYWAAFTLTGMKAAIE